MDSLSGHERCAQAVRQLIIHRVIVDCICGGSAGALLCQRLFDG